MSSNMTSLTSPSGEILEMLQHLVNAVRNLLGFVYWGYNPTQYGVIKEVRGDNGQQSKAFFVFEKKTHLVPFQTWFTSHVKFNLDSGWLSRSSQYIPIIPLTTIIPSKRDDDYLCIESWPFSSSLHCSPLQFGIKYPQSPLCITSKTIQLNVIQKKTSVCFFSKRWFQKRPKSGLNVGSISVKLVMWDKFKNTLLCWLFVSNLPQTGSKSNFISFFYFLSNRETAFLTW